jgi:DNA-binding PadR family transcriptional regulator
MTELTVSETAILGLLAERPLHGYELDEVIAQRGLREWTEIGFSSIYFLLGKLEQKGCIRQKDAPASPKARKEYEITAEGRERLGVAALAMIADPVPRHSPLLVALANWPALDRTQALAALRQRRGSIAADIERLRARRQAQQPLPPLVDSLFSYGLVLAEAELRWLDATIGELEAWDG